MHLRFVGRGSAFNPVMKSNSAYCIVDNDFFLLDCGENVFGEIWDKIALQECRRIYVLITHLHSDHVGSLGSLISYCHLVLNRKIIVVHPVPAVVELLDLMGIDRYFYDYVEGLPLEECSMSVTSVEVEHANDMKCFGYILEIEQTSIYYSGDALAIPERILESFFKREIQLIYQDTSTCYKDNPSHCHIGYLDKKIPEELRKNIYCMHLDRNFEIIKNKGYHIVEIE